MKRANKTLRRKLQKRQRTRNSRRYRKRQTRRQKGGDLPVPPGALVAVSTGGEYGIPILLPVQKYMQAKEGLED